GGQVVDLVRADGLDQAVEPARVRHVAVVEDKARGVRVGWVRVLEVVDAPAVHARGAAYDAVHLVTLAQEQLGQVGAVLSGDSSDESGLGHCRGQVYGPGL